MFLSNSESSSWTRCPMFFPKDYKHNPTGKYGTDERWDVPNALYQQDSKAMVGVWRR